MEDFTETAKRLVLEMLPQIVDAEAREARVISTINGMSNLDLLDLIGWVLDIREADKGN